MFEGQHPVGASRRELDDLLGRARAGDSHASQELFDKYAKHFLAVIRRKIARRLRTIFDSTDFLQEMRLELFFNNLQAECASIESFQSFLAKVAENQVLSANRKFLDRQRRNLHREVPLERMTSAQEPIDGDPDPEVIAMEHEEWDRLLEGQNAINRQVLELLRAGFTHREVAAVLRINEKHIRRLLGRMQEKNSCAG